MVDMQRLTLSGQTVSHFFPAVRNVPVVRCWAGLDGLTPDAIPVIGPGVGTPGAFHAFGFSEHGFQLGPVVGRILAGLAVDGRSELPIAPFRIDRFD